MPPETGCAPFSGWHAPYKKWRVPFRVSPFQVKPVRSLLSDVRVSTVGVCLFGRVCASLTNQDAFLCIFHPFSVLFSSFSVLSSAY